MKEMAGVLEKAQLELFPFTALSNIVNAFAKFGDRTLARPVFLRLTPLLRSKCVELDAQQIALVANAFARLGFDDWEMFRVIDSRAAQLLREGGKGVDSRVVTCLMNAFGKSNLLPRESIPLMFDYIASCLAGLSLQVMMPAPHPQTTREVDEPKP